jgi:hypothetical protein
MADDPNLTPVPNGPIVPPPGTPPTPINPTGPGPGDLPPAARAEILSDLRKHKDENLKLQAKIREIEDEKLKTNNQFKELYEREKTARTELEQKNERIQKAVVLKEKYSAVKDVAVRMGLRKEAMPDLDLIDMEEVVVETTNTGKVNILGADSFVEKLKAIRPHWFDQRTAAPINSSTPRVSDPGGPVTTQQILEAEKEGRKKGDLTQYRELYNRYRQQQAAVGRR